MTETCHNDNIYVKPYEVCNFKALQKLKDFYTDNTINSSNSSNTIFNSFFSNANPDLNANFRDSNNLDYNYKYDPTKKDLCYSVKNNSNFNVNCAIVAGNPYFTYNEQKKTCSPIPNLKLPDNFFYEYENNNTYIYYNDDNNKLNLNYIYKERKAFCENKWYDWIIVPNYHFGNQIEKDAGIYSKNDVRKCYKPCNKGYLPYTALNGSNICALKENVMDGLYANKLDYSPIALINIIGNSEDLLTNLYSIIKIIAHDSIDKKKYDTNDDIINQFDTDNEIKELYDKIKHVLWNNVLDYNNYNIKNYIYNTKVLTYKNPLFNEDDETLLTYRGMSSANMLTDAILVHTYYIAYNYYTFVNTEIFKKDNYYNKDKDIDFTKIDDKKYFNVSKNINDVLSDFLDAKKGIFNNIPIVDDNEKKQIIHRIANIFYKAINICYDGKTDFSTNIIQKTKIAFKNISRTFKTTYFITDDDLIVKISNVDNIEFDYYNYDNTNKTEKDELKKMIIDNVNTFETDENKRNKIKEKIKTFVFYSMEDTEKTSKCSTGKIENPNNKNNCENCKEVCKTDENNNTCITNPNCKLFCKDICIPKPTLSPSTKCGTVKDKPEKTTNNEKKINTNDINTPVDENSIQILDNITNAFRIAIKIFFSVIVIYLIYIFYQIYGETILTMLNLLFYYLAYLWYSLINIPQYFSKNGNEFSFEKAFNEYKKYNADNNYVKVVSKSSTVIP